MKCLGEVRTLHLHSSFNSIIRASILKGSPLQSLLHFKTLLSSHPIFPDDKTFALILGGARNSSEPPEISLQIHTQIVKSGFQSKTLSIHLFHFYLQSKLLSDSRLLLDEIIRFDPDPIASNLLIVALLRNGEVDKASDVFREMPVRDLVTWNSMIAGLIKNSRPEEGLLHFRRMVDSGVKPDGFTYSSTLSGCSRTGALSHGVWVHRLMEESFVGFESNPIVMSALIDMYSKCGRIELARQCFSATSNANVSVFNSMMAGLASHGLGKEAIRLFVEMLGLGISPDSITFLGLLTALSHSGLVDVARSYFESMKQTYSIEPEVEHYGSLVDAMARAGQLDEALMTIGSMTIKPDSVVWRAFLSGCRRHQRADLAELAIKQMADFGSGDYVMVSNIYSSAQRFACAERVWGLMREKRVRKDRGLSWVELGGKLHRFTAGCGQNHIDIEAIHRVMIRLMRIVKAEGFVPMSEIVTMDVDIEEKEENLSWHSEKIAVAYSVLETGPGTEIRVSKNLMTCSDCHEWMKVVSKVLCRVIVVRDRVRFHTFESGSCSCGDYW